MVTRTVREVRQRREDLGLPNKPVVDLGEGKGFRSLNKRTPEKVAEDQKEGQQFVREREKLAGRLKGSGLSPKAAREEASKRLSGEGTSTKLGGETPQEQEALLSEKARQTGVATELQDRGVFEEIPTRQSLAPTELDVEGGITSVKGLGKSGLAQSIETARLANIASKNELQLSQSDPDLIREELNLKIEKKIKKVSAGDALGIVIEGFPPARAANKFIGGLFATPSAKVDDILKEMAITRERASNIESFVNKGTISPNIAFDQLDDLDANLSELEQQVKFFIEISPELRASPEEVSKIEEEILRIKERSRSARQSAAVAKLQRVQPTDMDLFATLERLR